VTCFYTILIIVIGVLMLASLIRWFDEATEAVQNRWWNKVTLLLLFPFSCWFFPSKVAAGRPTAVPLHEPVRGFGSLGKAKPSSTPAPSDHQAPPRTPPEFLVKPQIPPKKPKPDLDPDKIAKLKAKMKEQGMLGDE